MANYTTQRNKLTTVVATFYLVYGYTEVQLQIIYEHLFPTFLPSTETDYEAIQVLYSMDTECSFPSGKVARPCSFQLPPSAVVKTVRSYTSTLPYAFMVWCLIKHMGKPNTQCQSTKNIIPSSEQH